MIPRAIKWGIDSKIPVIYNVNKKHSSKSYGVCLICEEGRTEHSRIGTFSEWYAYHNKKSACTKRWDEVAHYFINAYKECDAVEDCEVKEVITQDVGSSEPVKPVRAKPVVQEQNTNIEDLKAQIEKLKHERDLLYGITDKLISMPAYNTEMVKELQQEAREVRNKVDYGDDVGNSEPAQEQPQAQQPPTPPILTVQNDSSDTESRNEIQYVSSNSETTADDEWETRSQVSCSPMDYWDMENPGVRRIFGVLSDILEQEMPYKQARAEYKELLEELEPDKDTIGKPWKVLEAYILDEYTKEDLENFLALQD
jgi:hypothetical protein